MLPERAGISFPMLPYRHPHGQTVKTSNCRDFRMKHLLTYTLSTLIALTALSIRADTQTILLRNVTLVDRQGAADKQVSILIKDAVLDIITEDLIPIDEADESYDAGGGVILGQLNLGEPASFMILDTDPRRDFKVLLDTKTHVSFAIAGGEVVRNRYVMILEETPDGICRRDR